MNHHNFGVKLFSEYIADPSAASSAEPGELKSAIEKYPYCQLLHLFYSRSLVAQGSSENSDDFARTALMMPDRTVLYTVLNNPEKLNNKPLAPTDFIEIPDSEESLEIEEIPAKEDEVVIDKAVLGEETITEEILEEKSVEEEPEEEIVNEDPLAEEIASKGILSEEKFFELSVDAEISQTEPSYEAGQLIAEEEIFEASKTENKVDIAEEKSIPTSPETEINDEPEWSAKTEPKPVKEPTVRQQKINDSDLIENIFNQLIGAVPPPITPVAVYAVSTPFTDEDFISEPKDPASADSKNIRKEEPTESKEEIIEIKAQEETKIKVEEPLEILDVSQVETKPEEMVAPINVQVTESPIGAATGKETDQNVSKYDDDKMPYSFLWWLNKTRNEHSDTYQPFVEFKLDTSQTIKRNSVDQLSSQIIENIFHLQSPLEELENAPKTVPFQVRRKEDSILDKFIKEEPQIKPPNSQKLDTENKARKSAEDPNDLVSETLAQIYTDQMLFQKAIDTFKKLSLKFPEKSTYFADQIIELEKKVN